MNRVEKHCLTNNAFLPGHIFLGKSLFVIAPGTISSNASFVISAG